MAVENKRNFPRFDSLNLLSYTVFDEDGERASQGMGRTLNVSESGILLETHVPVASNHQVEITLGLEENLVEFGGKAVYSREGENDMFETGVEFSEIDDAQHAILIEFITAFEAQP